MVASLLECQLADRGGYSGSFFTGVLATVVASPCTAPFMGTALGFAVTQPAPVALAIFAALGSGMAAPMLLLSYSRTLRDRMPKPGPWMETFKQVMGFLMLATVVWFFTILDWPQVIPTFGFLIAIWFACWWIGRLPFDMSRHNKVKHWAAAIFVPALAGVIMFSWLEDTMAERFNKAAEKRAGEIQEELAKIQAQPKEDEGKHKLPWQDFDTSQIDAVVSGV